MRRYGLVCGVYNGLQLFLLLVSILTRNGIGGRSEILRVAGFSVFALGLVLLVYSGVQLRRATRTEQQTEREALATDGPCRFVRHAYYLSDLIVSVGLAIGLRSVWGIVGTLLVLIPTAIHVARLEEEVLSEEFGEVWRRFTEGTYFMFPLVY